MTEETIDLDPERQKEIEALEARVHENHFDFLGLKAGASRDEVRDAFHALSRKFHPDRYFGKNLGPFRSRLDKVFKRLVEANEVLTDPDKLAAYIEENPFVRAAMKKHNKRHGIVEEPEAPAEKTPEAVARDAERRARLARHPYLAKTGKVNELLIRAKAHVAKNEYAHAFTQLNMAAQFDPTNVEVKTLLNDVRRKNEEQRAEVDFKRGTEALERNETALAISAFKNAVNANPKHAASAFKAATLIERLNGDPKEASSYAQKAVDAEPNNVEYRLFLARVLDAAGMKAMAKRHFDEAARLEPTHPEVKKYAKRRWPF